MSSSAVRNGAPTKTTVRTKLHENLVEFGSLTKKLLEALSASGKPTQDTKGVNTEVQGILQKLTSRDEEIQKLAAIASEVCDCQQEATSVQEELDQRKQEVCQLQANLQEAEKIIELAVYKGRQKLESIEQAEKGAVSPEDLIKYAHHISQSSTVVSPVGWQIGDSRRPFPQDIEMRRGFLGQLTSGIKPRPEEPSDVETAPPPEKKFALGGMNRNLNNHEGGASSQLALTNSTSKPATMPVAVAVSAEPEVMSEDSSASSDEGT